MISLRAYALILLGLVTAGCQKEATGQVAAVVGDEEITLQEINAEMGNAALPDSVDKDAVRRAALERIIDRKLLAQEARKDGIEESPDYLLRERQMRDGLAVRILGERAERALRVPDQAEVDRFIADNPLLFESRKIFTLDRIVFPAPENVDRLGVLQDDHSMEAVAASLNRLGIDFRRDTADLDSAQLGAERLQRIQALPAGEPFVVPENGMIVVAVITGSRDAPLTRQEARPLAAQALRNKQLAETLQQRLKQARSSTEIRYQPDFAPETNDSPAESPRPEPAVGSE
jgi:EpsD family peptidyl-prolyl cis-trans isomerase